MFWKIVALRRQILTKVIFCSYLHYEAEFMFAQLHQFVYCFWQYLCEISLRMSEIESEWDEEEWDDGWDDHEWHRRVDPLVHLIQKNGQGEFFEKYSIGEEVGNGNCLSAIYILYCNQKNLKQKTKIFKVWDIIEAYNILILSKIHMHFRSDIFSLKIL